MSKSLQEQLRELGLAREPTSTRGGKRARRSDRQRTNPGPKPPEGRPSGELSLEEAFRLREEAERAAEREARRRKQEDDRRRRELNLAIRAVVEPNRLNDPAADEWRYFLYRGRIRGVRVTPDQREALNAGRLGVVYLAGSYHLLEPEHVAVVRQLSAEHVPDLAENADQDSAEEVPPLPNGPQA